jgi:hypothetical protein
VREEGRKERKKEKEGEGGGGEGGREGGRKGGSSLNVQSENILKKMLVPKELIQQTSQWNGHLWSRLHPT